METSDGEVAEFVAACLELVPGAHEEKTRAAERLRGVGHSPGHHADRIDDPVILRSLLSGAPDVLADSLWTRGRTTATWTTCGAGSHPHRPRRRPHRLGAG